MCDCQSAPNDDESEKSSPADGPDANVTFPTDLSDLEVGESAGLLEMETQHGYGRIAVEKTEAGHADIIKHQKVDPDADSGFTDVEEIMRAGRFFSREASWSDLHADRHGD